jgi:putative DNA primase/helicase
MATESKIVELQQRFDREAADNRRTIEVRNGELPRLVNQAEAALHEARAGIYQRGGMLVRIVQLDANTVAHGVKRAAGSVLIQPVTRDYLVLALARAAVWEKFDGRSRAVRPIDPPPNVAGALLSCVGEWTFAPLRGLTAAPTLRTDGTLLERPGYDVSSGLYAAFAAGEFPTINPAATRDEALEALDLLDELFSECTFAGGSRSAHSSVAIAATVTAAVRHALPTAPAFGISASKQGSGKTTAAKAISHVTTGRDPPVLSLSDDEAELRKCILGILIAGDACVLIDNVAQPVDSAALCAVLTSAEYGDRLLGVNQKVTVPTASTWLLTGNHLEFVGDLTSRVLLSVLDPEVEHPEARPFKRDLAAYVAENRGKLLAAALTVPLAYLAAGAPKVDAPRSRFAEWDRLVRRPLLWLDATDPLDTQAELRAADPVREGLVALLKAWHECFGERVVSVADAIEIANRAGMSEEPQMREALKAVAGERNGDINSRRLGRYLVRNLRRIEDGKRLEDGGENRITCRRQFKVASVTSVIRVSANPTREIADSMVWDGTNTDNDGNDEST